MGCLLLLKSDEWIDAAHGSPLRVSRFSLSGDQTETVGSEKNGGEIKHRRM